MTTTRCSILLRRLAPHPGRSKGAAVRRDDSGSVLVLVLVVALLLVGTTTVALTTSAASSGQAGSYSDATTARVDAESGFQATMLQIKNATSVSGLPTCSAQTTPMAFGSYTVTVAYSSDGSPVSCPLTGTPPTTMTGVVTSTGQYRGSTAEIQGDLSLTSNPQPLPAFDYTIYTPQTVSMNSQAVVDSGSTTALPNIYAGGTLQCTNSNDIQGSVEVGQASSVTLSSNCTVAGTLYLDSGSLQVTNTASVGQLELFNGSLDMSSSGKVNGAAYVSNGSVTFDNPTAIVAGNLATTGSVTYSYGRNGGNVKGSICSGETSCIPAGVTMPAAPALPEVTDPGNSGWPAGTDYISVPSSKCSSFFSFNYPGGSGPTESTFTKDVNGSSAPVTVVDAPSCDVNLPSDTSSCPADALSSYTLGTNLVMFVHSFQDYGCITFQSASGTNHDVAIVVPYGDGTGGITGTNTTDFTSSVNVLLYTPGEVQFNCNGTITGQIVAGGEVYTTNNFTMTASNSAASVIPTAVQLFSERVALNSENLLKD